MQFLVDTNFWSILASIATILGFIVLTYTAILVFNQLKEMTKARHLEALLRVYDMIGSAEARKHRAFIYNELNSKPESLSPREREIVEQVSVTFDRIGILVESGLVPKKELFEGHHEIFVKTWRKLESYIYHLRQIAGSRWVLNFERLSEMSQEYHNKHYPQVPFDVV